VSGFATAGNDAAAERRLAVKQALELEMRCEPDDTALRARYFEHLERIARTHLGLCEAYLPGLPHPLLLRCGTSDIEDLAQVFLGHKYDFPLEDAPPARILDLGAYVGYAAIALANRFPHAQILCVEPVPANFRMLMLNTLPYRSITHLHAAAWTRSARLRVAAMHGGDRGFQLAETAEPEQGGYPAHAVAEILRMRGWDGAQFVKCTIEGGEVALFADPTAEWIGRIGALAIETHDDMVPGSSQTVAACFTASRFTHERHHNLDVFQRRGERRSIEQPPAIALIHSGPGLRDMTVRNVTLEKWGFFVFDDRGCQLHPNAPGGPPAQLVFTLDCQGQTRFSTVVYHAGQPAEDIVFRALIRRVADGAVIMQSARRVLAGVAGEWKEPVPKLIGRHEVILETEMAPGASSDMNAWARWIDPRLG
jgi:FkbM family methyltransferase